MITPQFKWLQGRVQQKVSSPASLVVIVTAIVLAAFIVGNHWRGYAQHQLCLGRRIAISRAEGKYWQIHHHFITGSDDAFIELVKSGFLREEFRCKQGGHYSVIDTGDGAILVHCSLPEHEENFNGSKGIKYRPDPALDAAHH